MSRLSRLGSMVRNSVVKETTPDSDFARKKQYKTATGHGIYRLKNSSVKLFKSLKDKITRLKKIKKKNVSKAETAIAPLLDESTGSYIEPRPIVHEKIPDSSHRPYESTKGARYSTGSQTPREMEGSKHEELSQHSEQTTDLTGVLKGASTTSAFSSVIGRKLQESATHAHYGASGVAGKVSSTVGEGVGAGVGLASTLQQAYKAEHSLKRASNQALSLLDSITIHDILSDRKNSLKKTQKVTEKEVEHFIEKKLSRNIQETTTRGGLTGTFTLGGLLGSASLFFPPLLVVAAIGVGAGLATTAFFRFFNKNRMEKKVQKLFGAAHCSKNKNLLNVKHSLINKVHALNNELPNIKMKPFPNAKDKVDFRKGVEDSNSILSYASSALGFVGRFFSVFSYISIGLGVLVSGVSTIFTGVTNYKDRQKKLNNLDGAIMEAIIPNISGRTFPYLRKPVFQSFIIRNKARVAEYLGMKKGVSNRMLFRKLNSPGYHEIKKKLMNECIKRLLKEQFSRYSGVRASVFEKMSESDFDKVYGHVFKEFVAEKVSGRAYKDTVKAGFNGSLTLSAGVLALSFIPGAFAITLPLAALTAGVGTVVTLLAAQFEKRKFRKAVDKAIDSDSPNKVAQKNNDLKRLLMEKNDYLHKDTIVAGG